MQYNYSEYRHIFEAIETLGKAVSTEAMVSNFETDAQFASHVGLIVGMAAGLVQHVTLLQVKMEKDLNG